MAASTLINPFRASIGEVIAPLLSIPTIALAIVGLIRTVNDYHSVRSYVLMLWLAVLMPVVGLNPTHLNVLFVPVMLLGAIGMQSLFRYWYDLFPRNPYARIFGLLPLGLLLASVIQFNYQRYFVGVPYARSAVQLYSSDAFLLHDTLASKSFRDERNIVITLADKRPLYQIDKAIAKKLLVMTPAQFMGDPTAKSVIVDESAQPHLTDSQRQLLPAATTQLLVNDHKDNALRFRIYSQ
jgi:hypothetical protein